MADKPGRQQYATGCLALLGLMLSILLVLVVIGVGCGIGVSLLRG